MASTSELRRGVFPPLQRHTFAEPNTEPFWDGARNGQLVVPRCASCGTFRLPPYPICYRCQSFDTDWVELPGTGTVFSYTVVHHPLHPDLAAVCPYVSAIVELDGTQGEGARMLVNIIDCEPDEIEIGTAVRVVFDPDDDMPTPRFVPLRPKED